MGVVCCITKYKCCNMRFCKWYIVNINITLIIKCSWRSQLDGSVVFDQGWSWTLQEGTLYVYTIVYTLYECVIYMYSCIQKYSIPIANQVYWQHLQTFSCFQRTNQTKVIEIAQLNKFFKWFLHIQLKMQLLMTSAVSELYNPFMASIFST